ADDQPDFALYGIPFFVVMCELTYTFDTPVQLTPTESRNRSKDHIQRQLLCNVSHPNNFNQLSRRGPIDHSMPD
ncbi:unnamed protein product, partial [Symbiodinium microadriaticum]